MTQGTITGPAVVVPACNCNVPAREHCKHTIEGSPMLKFWAVLKLPKGSVVEFARLGRNAIDITMDLAEEYPDAKVEVRPL